MTIAQCEHDAAVARAAATGPLPAELAAHAAGCGVCADTALVATALRAEAIAAAREPAPDPGAIWVAARRDARRQAAARAALPITVMTRAALAAGAATTAVAAIRLWPTVAESFAAFARTLNAPAAPAPGGPTLAFFSLAVVASLAAALALFESWAGE